MYRVFLIISMVFIFSTFTLTAQFPSIKGKNGSGVVALVTSGESSQLIPITYETSKTELSLGYNKATQKPINKDDNYFYTIHFESYNFTTSLKDFALNLAKNTDLEFDISAMLHGRSINTKYKPEKNIHKFRVSGIKPVINIKRKTTAFEEVNTDTFAISNKWNSQVGVSFNLAYLFDKNYLAKSGLSFSLYAGYSFNDLRSMKTQNLCVSQSIGTVGGKPAVLQKCQDVLVGSASNTFEGKLLIDYAIRITKEPKNGQDGNLAFTNPNLFFLSRGEATYLSNDDLNFDIFAGVSLSNHERVVFASLLFNLNSFIKDKDETLFIETPQVQAILSVPIPFK